MKNTVLVALVCGMFTMHVNASEQDDGFWFPNESITNSIVDESANQESSEHDLSNVKADSEVNNATKLKFTSRRAALNPAVKNQDTYLADDEWVGATYVDEDESTAGKRLNQQFRSKRPHINYQFD